MNNLLQTKLYNGLDVSIRPIRSGDAYELLSLHQRSSAETLYNRYLRTYTPSYDSLNSLCQLNQADGVVLVAVARLPWETVIGTAYYLVEQEGGPQTAEPAFHIEDRFQGLGLGKALYKALTQQAIINGVERFTAYVHPGNKAMETVFARGSYPVTSQLAYGTREIEVDLSLRSGRLNKRPLPLAV
ncbi:MAG: GNAT family N-acetyltransferase [Chloroflexota bacterium]